LYDDAHLGVVLGGGEERRGGNVTLVVGGARRGGNVTLVVGGARRGVVMGGGGGVYATLCPRLPKLRSLPFSPPPPFSVGVMEKV